MSAVELIVVWVIHRQADQSDGTAIMLETIICSKDDINRDWLLSGNYLGR